VPYVDERAVETLFRHKGQGARSITPPVSTLRKRAEGETVEENAVRERGDAASGIHESMKAALALSSLGA
jgi:hypothetical protein